MTQAIPTSGSTAESLPAQTIGSVADLDRLNLIYGPVKSELEQVETILRNELASESAGVDELLDHSRHVGGKRMRPLFLLLSGACCGKLTESHNWIAASLEMIHSATLIHDDVLDRADTRRHGPTANSRWGNKASVLLGDYLFTHAFHVATNVESIKALRCLATASNKVCAGEIRQNAWIGNFNISEEDYFEMISDKTAELCQVGCYLGAILAGANESTAESFSGFGRDLGLAFQIIDDVLDVVGLPSEVGKTLGTDIANGKPTLPVIHSLANLHQPERDRLLALLEKQDVTVQEVLPILNASQSIDYARGIAKELGNRAAEFAGDLPENEYSAALSHLAQFVLQRSH